MRRIIHLDADAFFASVEQAADPRLRGRPVAVGGEKRGIIASASYEARRFGVHTPMPTVRARKLCPKLIVLPGDFEKYERFSRWMFSYAYDFTPDVEISSIDEGYCDLTAARQPPRAIAEALRRAIRESLKIVVSEGLGSNKLVSQIASKLHKPAAFAEVPAGGERSFLHPLPNRWLPGVGPRTAGRLNAAGLASIGQIAATPLDLLSLLLGRTAGQLKEFSDGRDDRPVVPVSEPAKSYGQQETFAADTTDEEYIEALLHRMADHLMARVREDGKAIRTVTVKVRYNDMAEDQCGESLPEPTDLESDVYTRLRPLLRRAWQRRVSLRMVSLKFASVYDGFCRAELPLERTAQQHEARRRLAAVVDELRKTRGPRIILRGHDFVLREAPAGRGGPSAGPKSEAPSPKVNRSTALASAPPAFIRHSAVVIRHSPAIPLHAHSCYSFLDSTLSVEAIVELARRHELPAVALTDTANLHGAVAFVQAARAAGLRPILGAEIRVTGRPLRLYVQSATGYANLCRILSQRPEGGGRRAEGATGGFGADSEVVGKHAADRWSRHRDSVLECGGPQPLLHESATSASGRGLPRFKTWRSLEPFVEGPADHIPSSALEQTDGLLAVSPAAAFAPLFPGRFYLEVSSPEALRKRDGASRLPLVAALPIHYATPADRWKYDIVQSIRTLTLLRQEHPDKRLDGDFHFRAPREMQELFGRHPELLTRTHEIAGRCAFEFPFGKPQFPAFRPPDGSTPPAFLRRLVLQGLRERYPDSQIARRQPQVEEELRIIREVGYEEYFLVVWDLLQECRRRGIEWITRGSAADSLVCYCLGISNVCPVRFDLYFRRFLNKERMALHKLPDIDLDFPHDRKDDVVDLLFEKYGAGHCAVVGGLSTFQARSAFAEVAKVLGVAEREVRKFTEHFPWRFGSGEIAEGQMQRAEGRRSVATEPNFQLSISNSQFAIPPPPPAGRLVAMLRASPECRDLPLDEEPYRSALVMAEFLDGFPRYPKMHPCGVVLSRQPMRELTPTFNSHKGYPTTHFDMDAVEAIGLVKIDILAQGGLAVMRDVKAMLRARGVEVDLERFTAADVQRCRDAAEAVGDTAGWKPALRAGGTSAHRRVGAFSELVPSVTVSQAAFDDPAVWDLIAGGQARAVHHIESPAMVSLCRMCNVRDIDGLIAIVSVIRPGAANEQKKVRFTRRYQGLEPVAYPHPSLERCLRSTFGLVVYEEHILQICEAFAGLPPGRADVLRRALNKQKGATIREIQGEFAAAARAHGHTDEKIAEVWALVTGFAGYAFCKAHSTAYGVEAYQSAWLKRYFPAEFMAAVLTHGKGFYHPLVYVLECHRLGIPLRPPWVNEPGPAFQVVSGEAGRWRSGPEAPRSAHSLTPSLPHLSVRALRVPVTRVQNLTARTKDRILAERARGPFESLRDFYRRVGPSLGEMETLMRVGAFDGFDQSRTAQFWECQHFHHAFGDNTGPAQGWLLPLPDTPRPPQVREPTRRERLQWEMELLGFPASGHPLELHDDVAWDTYCPVARLGEHVGEEVVTCGLVIEQRIHHQVTGEPMKFLTLADWTGMVETELFASTYRSYGLATVRYPVLEITARVEPFENGRGQSLRVLRAGRPRLRQGSRPGPAPDL
jgi:DNA-directed DNA polymerase III PolC